MAGLHHVVLPEVPYFQSVTVGTRIAEKGYESRMNRMLAIVEDGNEHEIFIDGMENFFCFSVLP